MQKVLKIVYFIPTIIFTIFYGWACYMLEVGFINTDSLFFLIPFTLAGIVLCRKMFWGSFIGMIPVIYSIFGSIDGAFLGIEITLSIMVLVFYTLCGYYVYIKRLPSKEILS